MHDAERDPARTLELSRPRACVRPAAVLLAALACGTAGRAAAPWRKIVELQGDGRVMGITFSVGGSYAKLLTAGRVLEVWDVRRPQRLLREEDVTFASWHGDRRTVWGRKAEEIVYFRPWERRRWVTPIATTGDRAVYGGHSYWKITREPDGSLELWDRLEGTWAGVLRHRGADLTKISRREGQGGKSREDICIKARPTRIVAKHQDGSVIIWPVDDVARSIKVGPHVGRAYEVVFSRDGSHVLTRGQHRGRVWDAETGRLLCTLGREPTYTTMVTRTREVVRHAEWHEECGFAKAVFSADGQRIATIGKIWCLWATATGKRLATLDPGPPDERRFPELVKLAPDGKTLFLATHIGWRGGTVWLWDLETGELIARVRGKPTALDSPILPTRVVTFREDVAEVRSLSGGHVIATLSGAECRTPGWWSADGKRIVLVDRQTWRWSLWSLETGKRLARLQGWLCGTREPYLVGFGPTKEKLNSVTVVESQTGATFATLSYGGTLGGPWAAAGGRSRIATCSKDGALQVWDVRRGQMLVEFQPHDGPIAEIRMAADGRTIATRGKDDRRMILWGDREE